MAAAQVDESVAFPGTVDQVKSLAVKSLVPSGSSCFEAMAELKSCVRFRHSFA